MVVTVEGGHSLGSGSALWLKKVKGSGNLLQGLVDHIANPTAGETGAVLNSLADGCDKLRHAIGNRNAAEAGALLHALAANCQKLRDAFGNRDTADADTRLVALAGFRPLAASAP